MSDRAAGDITAGIEKQKEFERIVSTACSVRTVDADASERGWHEVDERTLESGKPLWALEYHPTRSWLVLPTQRVKALTEQHEGRVPLVMFLPEPGRYEAARAAYEALKGPLPAGGGPDRGFDYDPLEGVAEEDSLLRSITWSRFEVKTDVKGVRTGNHAVEVRRALLNGGAEPTGIASTLAQWWAVCVDDLWLILHVEHVKALARRAALDKTRRMPGGDGKRSRFITVPLSWFLKPACRCCWRPMLGSQNGQ